MSATSSEGEKQRYWERLLWDLLRPIPITDLLILSWSIEAFRDGRKKEALGHTCIPGEPEDHKITGKYFIPPWNIDGVLNERLVLGPAIDDKFRRLNLKNWGSISKLLNTYNGLANVESVKDFSDNGIAAAIPRLFWPQYDWQLGFENVFRIARAWHVYATPEGKQAFAQKHSIDLELFLKIAFATYAATEAKPAVRTSLIKTIGATNEEIYQVRKSIGETLDGHAKFASDIRNSIIPLDFRRSAVKERPLFEVEDRQGRAFFVPSRAYLLLRITDGLYYDIVQDGDARRSSGEYFEDLCFRLIQHYCSRSSQIEREKDTSYGKSADIFVMEKETELGLIIECKIRRIPQKILTSPDPWRDCEEDFSDIVKGVLQVWRTQDECMSSTSKDMVGVVLQYDPWTVMGNSFLKELFQRANRMADDLSISESNRIPVALVGYADFERSLRSYSVRDVHDAVSRSIEEKYHGYELSGVLNTIAKKGEKKPGFDYSSLAHRAVSWWGQKQ